MSVISKCHVYGSLKPKPDYLDCVTADITWSGLFFAIVFTFVCAVLFTKADPPEKEPEAVEERERKEEEKKKRLRLEDEVVEDKWEKHRKMRHHQSGVNGHHTQKQDRRTKSRKYKLKHEVTK